MTKSSLAVKPNGQQHYFAGSYSAGDVNFLLKQADIPFVGVTEKEQLIQSGAHYSSMLSHEKLPSERYMQLFWEALDNNEERFSKDIATLAVALAERMADQIVLVSLARAGTPVGVLLHRALKSMGRDSHHYSVSIIRDKGIDQVALDYILAQGHRAEDIVFIDGWTGKGAIATELAKTIGEYNHSRKVQIDPAMVVVADLAGVAGLAATSDDYLIPSAILNGIVSGLVSRTVLNDKIVAAGDFHACYFYDEYKEQDLSRYFVDRLSPIVEKYVAKAIRLAAVQPFVWNEATRQALKAKSDAFVERSMTVYEVADRNRVKPGVGESTRALLRRVPDCLILRERGTADVAHLETLAQQNKVKVIVDSQLPYAAAVIIATLGDD